MKYKELFGWIVTLLIAVALLVVFTTPEVIGLLAIKIGTAILAVCVIRVAIIYLDRWLGVQNYATSDWDAPCWAIFFGLRWVALAVLFGFIFG